MFAAGALVHTALINWTHASTVRFGAEEWARTRSLRQTISARAPLLLAALIVAAAVLVAQPFDWLGRAFGLTAFPLSLVALAGVGVWLAAEAQAVLQATDWMRVQSVAAPLAPAAAMVAFELARPVSTAGAVTIVGTAIAGVWAAALTVALSRARVVVVRPSAAAVRQQLVYAAPLIATFALGYVSDWGDHLLLRWRGTLSGVGQFGVAYQMFLVMIAASGLLTTVLLPRLIVLNTTDKEASHEYVRRIVPTFLTLWAAGGLVLIAFAPAVLIAATGADYKASGPTLVVLATVVPAHAVVSLYSVLFSLQGRLGRQFFYLLLMSAINVAGSIWLIPEFGAVGPAIATACSYLVVQLCYFADQHAFLGESAARVLPLLVMALGLGLSQVFVSPAAGWRALWLAAALFVLALVARKSRSVDAGIVSALFTGPLQPIGNVIRTVTTS